MTIKKTVSNSSAETKRNKRRNGHRQPFQPQPTGKPKTPVSGGGR